MIHIAGVVVLYNPSQTIFQSIDSYRKQISVLFVVDNSEYPDLTVVEKIRRLENIHYTWNGGNFGVAKGLNMGARSAVNGHYDFLLMMDQDSVAAPDMVHQLLTHKDDDPKTKVAILYPYHSYYNYRQAKDSKDVTELFWGDTAGSLLRLSAYQQCGPFLDDLFIDYVDVEYCLRLQSAGYKILQVNKAIIYQSLGNMVSKKFIFRTVGVTNYSPIRVFYRIRNGLYVARKYFRKYPWWSFKEMIAALYVLLKLIVFERDRRKKLQMALQGMKYSITGILGVYSQNH